MKRLTVEEVEDRVAVIASFRCDPEAAHSEEDDLYRDVLESIAGGNEMNAVELARAALKTKEIKFERWCA